MSKRKRKIAVLAIVFSLALFAVGYGFAFPAGALAWDNCPKGLVNDPYPGACRRYVDTNNDGICDLSQSCPGTTATTAKSQETTTTTAPAVVTTASGTPPTGDCPLGPCSGCGACLSSGVTASASSDSTDGSAALIAAAGSAVTGDGSSTTSTTTPTSGGSSDSLAAATAASASVAVASGASAGGLITHYLVSPIAIGFLLIYGVSFFLYRSKRIKMATHRKVWNMLLAATFLTTGVFGTILAFQLDYAPLFDWPINLLFWHVEAGIVMTFISLFHLAWHFKYYKAIVRNARAKWRLIRSTEKEFDLRDGQLVMEAREARRAQREARKAGQDSVAVRRAHLAERGAPVAVRIEKVAPRPFDIERSGA